MSVKIMMVLEATAGGSARHVTELARGCQRRGFDVHLVCGIRRNREFRSTLRELEDSGLTVHELDMLRELHPLHDAAAALRLRRLVLTVNPQVLHLHSSKAGGLGRSAVVGLGRSAPQVIYTPHAFAFLACEGGLSRWLYRCLETALTPWTDELVAVSESEGQAALGLGVKQVTVIPNGVDAANSLSPDVRPPGPLRIGWLGRLGWQKNPEGAIKTSQALFKQRVDHELLLGGLTEMDLPRENCTQAAGHSVRMLGFVHDTNAFHAGVDIFLMTSRCEGLPYSGLDAMSHGRPIVGFDVPGVKDLVEHGVTGLLAPRGDCRLLAANIARLARDVKLRQALGVAAQHRVRRKFQLKAQLDRLSDLYRWLASTGKVHNPETRKPVIQPCPHSYFTE